MTTNNNAKKERRRKQTQKKQAIAALRTSDLPPLISDSSETPPLNLETPSFASSIMGILSYSLDRANYRGFMAFLGNIFTSVKTFLIYSVLTFLLVLFLVALFWDINFERGVVTIIFVSLRKVMKTFNTFYWHMWAAGEVFTFVAKYWQFVTVVVTVTLRSIEVPRSIEVQWDNARRRMGFGEEEV